MRQRGGVTLGMPDLILAAQAVHARVPILSHDAVFVKLAAVTPLKLI